MDGTLLIGVVVFSMLAGFGAGFVCGRAEPKQVPRQMLPVREPIHDNTIVAVGLAGQNKMVLR